MLQRLWQSFIESLPVIGIGLGVVFVGLVSLIGIICLMSFFVRLFSGEKRLVSRNKGYDIVPEEGRHTGSATVFTPVPAITGPNRREAVAAVSAAIAEYLGEDASAIRIHSIKQIGAPALSVEERRELVAVISASIAAELGMDVTGIRIHSIKKAA